MRERLYFEKEETKIVKTKGYIDVDFDFIQVFKGILNSINRVDNGNSIKLLFFLICEKGDKLGEFSTSESSYTAYCRHLEQSGKSPIALITFREYIKDLFNAGLILKVSKGVYRFNPIYIWEGKIDDRKNLIIDLYKEQVKQID